MIRILGKRYKRLYAYEVRNMIENVFETWGCELSPRQKEVLKREFYQGYTEMPFQAFVWESDKTRSKSIWWRLTWPFFFIWCMLSTVIIYPIHWLLTGNSSNPDWNVKITRTWYDNVVGL